MPRVIIYIRQSQAKRGEAADESLSLDSQETACRASCERHGWIVVNVIRDHDVRGSDPNRPGMRDLMDRARRREMDVVVVFSMSRFARDNTLQELAWRELRRLKVRVESLNEPNIEHTLIRGMLGVVNQYRSEEIGQHVSAATRQRAARGLTWGRVPFGYVRASGALTPHETEAPVVVSIFRWWTSGLSCRRIAERLNADAVPTHTGAAWERDVVSNLLKNPVYVGDVRSGGRVVARDAHTPLIDRTAWDEAQARFTAPKPRDKPAASSWAEGMVIHGCGARMYLVTMPDRNGRSYESFRCHRVHALGSPCPLPSRHLSKRLLEAAVRRCLIADLRGALDPATAVRRLRRQSGSAAVVAMRQGIEDELAEIAAQRREAEALVLQRRRDLAWLDARDTEFAREEARLTAKLAALPTVPDEGRIVAAAGDVAAARRGIVALDGAGLGALLARVGVAVVGEDGVRISYLEPWSGLIPRPVVVDPKARA